MSINPYFCIRSKKSSHSIFSLPLLTLYCFAPNMYITLPPIMGEHKKLGLSLDVHACNRSISKSDNSIFYD